MQALRSKHTKRNLENYAPLSGRFYFLEKEYCIDYFVIEKMFLDQQKKLASFKFTFLKNALSGLRISSRLKYHYAYLKENTKIYFA